MYRRSNEYERIDKLAIDIYVDYELNEFSIDEKSLCKRMEMSLVPYSAYEGENRSISNVKAPEYSHTARRIYAIVKNGELKHLAFYDESHKQSVSIDLAHEHKGVKPYRHVYLCHDKNAPGIPPTAEEAELIKKIKKEFHLR